MHIVSAIMVTIGVVVLTLLTFGTFFDGGDDDRG